MEVKLAKAILQQGECKLSRDSRISASVILGVLHERVNIEKREMKGQELWEITSFCLIDGSKC